ncbi:phosphodiesterase [Thalassobius sp. Cn5-15]|uniref:phosphodiesterase n=1 Tax=Thalassobius sp. Cn5-15 TaxID=2917763 RepID=UPI001EF248EA|nr:phosphodiesterase [Thalassobius sp. Cn5-15]MCG7494834.1 phosphodiesterase [Thalassobius sp. Cn5-15]
MSKILVMTDLHITTPPETIINLSPVERAREALAHAARHHHDANHLVITGDLTNEGTADQYASLKPLLQGLPWPVTMLMGNHDLRAPFRAAFPTAAVTDAGFVQAVVDLPDVRLITLDTLDTEAAVEHAGRLCPARLNWLEQALKQAGGKPCLLFLHHPPFETGFSGMDGIGLINADALLAMAARYNVRHLFAGHIHRTITATIQGKSMTVFKSTCHQMPMMLGKEGFAHSVPEPGAYGIILTRGADVVVHTEDFSLPEMQSRHFADG